MFNTLDEIRSKIDEIEQAMNEDGANIEELSAQLEEARNARIEIEKGIEARKSLIEKVKEEGKVMRKFENTDEPKEEGKVEVRSTTEYAKAYAKFIRTGRDEECRALLTENVSGTVPVPTLLEGKIQTAWEKNDITSRVNHTYFKGNLVVGFELSATDAVIHVEGTAAPDEEVLTLGKVELKAESIKKWITISDEVIDLTEDEFLNYIYDELAYRIAKKAADTIIAKIVASPATSTASAVGVDVIEAAPAKDTIAQAVAKLSDEADTPVIIMNKQTYANFKSIQYNANYAVDVFDGLEVIFNNSLPAFNDADEEVYAIVGDLRGVTVNHPNGDDVTFKYDDTSLAEQDLVKIVGRQMAGIGVTKPYAFCCIKSEA